MLSPLSDDNNGRAAALLLGHPAIRDSFGDRRFRIAWTGYRASATRTLLTILNGNLL
jgi:hypothetical protein